MLIMIIRVGKSFFQLSLLTLRRGLDEMKHFDEVIAYIESTVNLEETLVIVTADHSHAFELIGQPGRFQDVLGLDQYYSNHVSDILSKPISNFN